jgi:uncharacterized protein (DUF58 family)
MRLLPRESAGKLGRLEFLARGVVEGFIAGRHKSPHKGFSVEFAEHRQYVAGDDIRWLDWRVFGRSDRYYIKEFIEETNLRATIIVDASNSMRYVGDAAATVDGERASKFEYARYMAAALAYLLINQQDAVGLVTFDAGIRDYIPARAQPTQIRRILERLNVTEPAGETRLAAILHDVADRIPRRGLVILLSDLFDDADEMVKALHHFAYNRHEVVVFHIMAEEELTFPFPRFTDFRDLEGVHVPLPVEPKAIRAQYLDAVRSFVKKFERSCGEMKADYVPMTTRRSFDTALADYLSHRRKGR